MKPGKANHRRLLHAVPEPQGLLEEASVQRGTEGTLSAPTDRRAALPAKPSPTQERLVSRVPASPTELPPGFDGRPVMFYDGGCRICRREVAFYRRLDRAGQVRWHDITLDTEPLAVLGVGQGEAQVRLHALDRQGRLRVGAAGFVAVWRELPYWRWLARLADLPGMVGLMDAIYRPYARWRFRRRCAQGACHL